jgi:chromatin segregation and condensation protein Rec8/ScpA/Scc1 (kleisin family)
MSNYEPHKMISLKLAGLSRSDQNWILKQLPPEVSEKIKNSLHFVRKLRATDTDSLFQKLLSQQEEMQSRAIENNHIASMSLSTEFNEHLTKISFGQVQVTEHIKSFVTQYLARSAS